MDYFTYGHTTAPQNRKSKEPIVSLPPDPGKRWTVTESVGFSWRKKKKRIVTTDTVRVIIFIAIGGGGGGGDVNIF